MNPGIGFLLLALLGQALAAERPNVLFIAVDDLRTELGCYGSNLAKSPNIDALAASGIRFDRAYCQQAICGPSRASVMTGLRPDAVQIHGNHTHFRDIHPDIVTLPQHFKNHGYHTRSMGKIYHGVFPEGSSRTVADTFGDEPSWSVPTFRPGPRYYYTKEGIAAAKEVYERLYKPADPGPGDWTTKLVFGPATEAPDVVDNVLYDGQVADRAVASLRELAGMDQPFFLAVGFIKPHSPYIAPKKYWDLYDAEAIPLAAEETRITNAPAISRHGSGELRRYTDQAKSGPIPAADQRRVRHAYLACIGYIDAQIGRVLVELEAQGLAEDTIVVLWSDHGYHLGEKDLWGKTTNFELDTRVPLIIRVPGHEPGVCRSPVELVDLYPTLAGLAGLPVDETLQGTSLAPLVEDPGRPWKSAAFSQFTRGKLRGYSVRTGTHRYTEWIDLKTGEVHERLLFDHRSDPHETTNLAGSAGASAMSRLLRRGEGWRNVRIPELTFGQPFTDHMVLQRDGPIRIWGGAIPAASIEIALGERKQSCQADLHGSWDVEFPPTPANATAQTLTATSEGEKVTCEDILIGDVWVCSGQSNMGWMLKQTTLADESIASSANPYLRLCNLASTIHPGSGKFSLRQLRSTFADNLFASEGWQVAGPETVPDFSGVAYHFGRALQAGTGVPIGLIHNAVGGSPMEAWIPSETRDPNWLENATLPEWVAGRAAHNLTHWVSNPAAPAPHHPFEPGFLFEAGIRPFTEFPVRGVIWYQGESNATEDGAGSPPIDPRKNFATHQKLIESWRAAWDDEDLPFYFVQLPGLNRDWAAFREVQARIDLLVPNTHMAVTLDLGHPTSVHPKNKKPAGERLANLALKHEYQKNVRAEAPRFTGWVMRESSIRLQFDRPVKLPGDALVAVAGKEGTFRSVPLKQHGPSALVFEPPFAVESIRYAWANDPGAAIVGAETGLPVAPFRTDSWPLVVAAAPVPLPPTAGSVTSFEGVAPGDITRLEVGGLKLSAEPGHAEIDRAHAFRGKQCLRLLGGADRELVIRFPELIPKGAILAFQAERWTKRTPFAFRISARAKAADDWEQIYDGSREVVVGRAFLSVVEISALFDFSELKLESTSPEGSGVLIDDLRVLEPKPMTVTGVNLPDQTFPVLIGKANSSLLNLKIEAEGTLSPKRVKAVRFGIVEGIEAIEALHFGDQRSAPKTEVVFETDFPLESGTNVLTLGCTLKATAGIDGHVRAVCTGILIEGGPVIKPEAAPGNRRKIGYALRQQGQDGVHSTRIPGLATSNAGTLIAVYDNRNRSGGDLPGDIDVGMSRSTDGGQSWEPMKVIMDMGDDPEWNYDGIGDPAVLVDRVTGTIWVAATWSHGKRSWHGSGSGLAPEETGQFMLVKSEDDGRTWSRSINITKQVKDPKWRFVLQGPGKGITLRDGTLVFPAQFRGANEEPVQGKPFSTLIYSKDRGTTWHCGTGVKIDTTEAQLVELGDGSIMINCRDNRGGSRSIYTTRDLGQTWYPHPTTRSALPEPVCMASLIRVKTKGHGPLLFFSNPPQASGRHHLTIKASNDEGATWPGKWNALVDERFTAYSCLTQVDDAHIGLVYEAPGELYFLRYRVDGLLR